MGRPPLPIGIAGDIRIYASGESFKAHCYFRDFDGVTRLVSRVGKSREAAKNNLKKAIQERGRTDGAAEITRETLVSVLAEAWYEEISTQGKSPNTLDLYRGRLDNQVLPALGALRVREVTVGRCDRLLKTVTQKNGASTAKIVRTVISGMLGLAARHDAMDHNPTRDTARIIVKRKPTRALTLDEARDLRARIAADLVAVRRDLPDFTDLMLATGMRIGEAAAVVRAAVNLEAETVEVRERSSARRARVCVSSPSRRRPRDSGHSSCRRGRWR